MDSQWQYEDQLKKWGAAKNLRQSDWRIILPVYDHLKAQGLEPQIRLGDGVLDERRVKRARRRYLGGRTTASSAVIGKLDLCVVYVLTLTSFQGDVLPARNHLWRLEIRRNGGEYYEYSLDDQSSENPDDSTTVALMQPAPAELDFDFQTLQSDPMWAPYSPFERNACSPPLAVFCPAIPAPETGANSQETPLSLFLQSNSPAPFLETLNGSFAPSSPQETGLSSQVRRESRSPSIPRRMDFKPYIDSIIESMYSDSLRTNSLGLQYADASNLSTKFESFIFEAIVTYGFENEFYQAPQQSGVVSKIPQIFVASIIDGLPSLGCIPPTILVSWIKTDPTVRLSVLAGLRSNNVAFAKALADRTFRLAIEAGDEDVVGMILETTAGEINKIDLNSKSCNLQDKCSLVTPLYVAVEMHSFGLVQKLLYFGAAADLFEWSELDSDSSYWESPYDTSDTEDAIAVAQIIDILFANGATLSVALLESLINVAECTGDITVLEKLVQDAFHQSHWGLLAIRPPGEKVHEEYPDLSVLQQIATKLDDKLAEKVICNLLQKCQSMGCAQVCAGEYRDAFNTILLTILERGQNGLAGPLINYVQPTLECLTAAIRSGDYYIIEMMLSRSINIGGPARCSEDLSLRYSDNRPPTCHHPTDKVVHWPTSPLAEAIRSQDSSLIGRLEDCGALQIVAEEASQLEAAIIAAVDIGHHARVESLLNLDANGDELYLDLAIATAIRKKNLRILKTLFKHQQEARNWGYQRYTNDCSELLFVALQARFHDAVNFIIDHSRYNLMVSSSALTEAVSWGEESVIVQLYDLGLLCPSSLTIARGSSYLPWSEDDIRPSPLDMAISTGNAKLLRLFLKWGADPPDVRVAVKVGAEDMVRLLLDQGAKPLGAKEAIVSGHHNILRLLLEHRATPTGLVEAVGGGDVSMLRLLLQYGADPANIDAFSLATLSDNAALLHTLSETFTARYPRGKSGFGFGALRAALLFCETSVLRSLLRLNFDVNSSNFSRSTWPTEEPSNILHLSVARLSHSYASVFDRGYYRTFLRRDRRRTLRRSDCEWNVITSLLLEAGVSTKAVVQGKTALLCAIEHKNLSGVKLLLERNADVNRPAQLGLARTPLQQACESGNLQIVELLLREGAWINAPPASNGGATALQLSAIQGSPRITRLLLDNGANIHAAPADMNGRTALEGAAEHGRLSILSMLLAEGSTGFDSADLQRAKEFAEKQMHRGCVERLNLALVRFGKGQGSRLSLEL
jgi:ankyrin repeat protein